MSTTERFPNALKAPTIGEGVVGRVTLQTPECTQNCALVADIRETARGVSEAMIFALEVLGRMAADEFERGANFLTGDTGLPRAFGRWLPAVARGAYCPGDLLRQKTENLFPYSIVRLESERHPAKYRVGCASQLSSKRISVLEPGCFRGSDLDATKLSITSGCAVGAGRSETLWYRTDR